MRHRGYRAKSALRKVSCGTNTVNYTGTGAASYTSAGATCAGTYNTVDVVYETRTDAISGYHFGESFGETKRLKNVLVYAEGQLFRDYQISYQSSATGRSRVAGIKECAHGGASGKLTEISAPTPADKRSAICIKTTWPGG